MQKAHSNLNISADKDKLKEPKTPTVPVTDPKKAPIVRDADQKAFERLKTIKASAVALLVASCLWYYGMPPSSRTVTGVERYTPANPGLNKQHSASPPGHAMLPPVVPAPIYPNDFNNKDKIVQSKSIDRDFKDSRYSIKQDLEVQSPAFNLFIGDELNGKNQHSPLYFILKRVVEQCKNSKNCALIDRFSSEESSIQTRFLSDIQLKTPVSNVPILIDFELKEYCQSSTKPLFNETPQNSARIKLVMRATDVRLNRIIFEEMIDQEVTQNGWANYEISGEQNNERSLVSENSNAMKKVQMQISLEILSIIDKYFP
jgi:hypothetical protein